MNHFHIVPCKKDACVHDGYLTMTHARQLNWYDPATGQRQTALGPEADLAAWTRAERYVARLYGDWRPIPERPKGVADAGT